MRTHPQSPAPQALNPADRPLSRKERRGKTDKQPAFTGKVHGPGRTAVPAAKHQNYRRG
ncbi:hypothetical protein [Nocardia huaxiensis]|uniref:Uncharacterized protein n=1 Tax=Nocardia huaxiensis TaxID=2755382 RepID=A0A7D6VF16_9NOCA|nr:hypothetical protein [Nocardia huaxiensis]QLY33851.1 hypothetical protein H0264_17845 [Nocardia huaxiensis]UFS99220.1 hypothetical protein LPY97_15670 [Nocardia huaxiensis]